MRHYGLAVTLLAAVTLVASSGWANVPDPAHCLVGDELVINVCPYNHPYGATDAERYQDAVVTLYTTGDEPVANFLATDFLFTVTPHASYDDLGGGTTGSCPNCENHYTVACQYTETNALGEMVVRVSLTEDCSPSMCCPVEVAVNLVGAGEIPTKISVLQNSHDLVPNAEVRGPDFGSFATAYNNWTGSAIPTECADLVYSAEQGQWGEVYGPDFGAFATHYTDCCGHIKETNPLNCDPWTFNPCP